MNSFAYAQMMQSGSHPAWCARGHHCTAAVGRAHASEQHILRTDHGRVVVTRYQKASGGNGTVEVRHLVGVPAGTEAEQAAWLAGLTQAVWQTVQAYPRP